MFIGDLGIFERLVYLSVCIYFLNSIFILKVVLLFVFLPNINAKSENFLLHIINNHMTNCWLVNFSHKLALVVVFEEII